MAKLSAKIPTPKTYSGEGEDLKPEAFDRWYHAVRLYLNLHGVVGNAEGSGNYWMMFTTGRASEAGSHALTTYGDTITREQLVGYLRSLFQMS
jgi:hypothetical protein